MKKTKESKSKIKKKKYQKPQIKTEKIKFQDSIQCNKAAFTPGCSLLAS